MPKGSVRSWAWTWGPARLAGLPEVVDGLSGVELVTSDAHQGLEERHRRGVRWGGLATLPHSLHGQPARVPKRAQPGVATMVRTIYATVSRRVHGQLDRVEQLREPFPQVAELLADAAPDILAFTACVPLKKLC